MNCNIKQKIRNRFNKAVASYDKNCSIQNIICEHAISLLFKHYNHFVYITDLACGTGESTKRLVQAVHYKKCYAIDLAENLLLLAKKKLSGFRGVDFIQGDLDEVLFKKPIIDLIFCNMGLQWSDNLYKAISLFYQYLNNNGILLFSMPISGNFPEIKLPFKPILPTHTEMIEILKKNKFAPLEYRVETLSITFQNQLDALKSLKAVGANYSKSQNQHFQGLSKLKLDRIFINSKNTQLTYTIGIYLAKKTIS